MPDQFPAAGDDYVRPMRCWQVHELGDPIDRLVLDEVEVPEAGTGRVVLLALIHIRRCRRIGRWRTSGVVVRLEQKGTWG